jgi:hypothetical protein
VPPPINESRISSTSTSYRVGSTRSTTRCPGDRASDPGTFVVRDLQAPCPQCDQRNAPSEVPGHRRRCGVCAGQRCSTPTPRSISDEEHATMTKTVSSQTHAGAQHFCRTVRSVGRIGPGPRVLVAGCGMGLCQDLRLFPLPGQDLDHRPRVGQTPRQPRRYRFHRAVQRFRRHRRPASTAADL